jgi:hypothetical protein
MEYGDLKSLLGGKAADHLEDAVLMALADAHTPEAQAALSRLLACLTAAVAYRATSTPDIADRCVSDFSQAYALLRREAPPKDARNPAAS